MINLLFYSNDCLTHECSLQLLEYVAPGEEITNIDVFDYSQPRSALYITNKYMVAYKLAKKQFQGMSREKINVFVICKSKSVYVSLFSRYGVKILTQDELLDKDKFLNLCRERDLITKDNLK